jgi:anti-anti-sigma factor
MSKRPIVNVTTTPAPERQAAVYGLSGKLTGDRDSYAFLDEVTEAVEDGLRHVVLELSGLDFCNSSGLGIIASIYNLVHAKGGVLVVVGANDVVRKAMEIIRLWALVENADSVEAALERLPAA